MPCWLLFLGSENRMSSHHASDALILSSFPESVLWRIREDVAPISTSLFHLHPPPQKGRTTSCVWALTAYFDVLCTVYRYILGREEETIHSLEQSKFLPRELSFFRSKDLLSYKHQYVKLLSNSRTLMWNPRLVFKPLWILKCIIYSYILMKQWPVRYFFLHNSLFHNSFLKKIFAISKCKINDKHTTLWIVLKWTST